MKQVHGVERLVRVYDPYTRVIKPAIVVISQGYCHLAAAFNCPAVPLLRTLPVTPDNENVGAVNGGGLKDAPDPRSDGKGGKVNNARLVMEG